MTRRLATVGGTLAMFISLTLAGGATAKEIKCNYYNKLKHGDLEFEVTGRPAIGNGVHVLRIVVRRNGNDLAQLVADMDGSAQTVVLDDLNHDSVPELVVTTRLPGSSSAAAVEVYALDGDQLQRVRVPRLPEEHQDGYRGRDSYRIVNHQLVRTFPVFAANDRKCCPTGGTRTIRYSLRDGNLMADSNPVAPAEAPALIATAPATPPQTTNPPPVPATEVGAESPSKPTKGQPTVAAITTGDNSIEIKIGGPLPKYKTMLLENPARLVIDLPGAKTGMSVKPVPIGKFGILQARVGTSKGTVRIVLDTGNDSIPQPAITSTADGLRIEFPPPAEQLTLSKL